MPQSPGAVRAVAVTIAAERTPATFGPRPSAYGVPATRRYSGECGRPAIAGGGAGGSGIGPADDRCGGGGDATGGDATGRGATGGGSAGSGAAGRAAATTVRSSPSAVSVCAVSLCGGAATGAITWAAVCTTAGRSSGTGST